MKKTTAIVPYISDNDPLILFDGVCKLCHGWSQFILKYDRSHVFKLATVQSKQGQAILRHFGLPTNHFDTMIYVEDNQAYQKSTAFLKVIQKLPYPIKLLQLCYIVPRFIRDWFYDRVALNRYRLFGKYSECPLPTADHNNRFL
ncbi:MAG: thiol-disulfide oxidoreductase DCC family protein [Proteobacteria bacterium]|nr:thiol-disulfide oxidoreductase DCC family protein [Pseudomonadota bacterium]